MNDVRRDCKQIGDTDASNNASDAEAAKITTSTADTTKDQKETLKDETREDQARAVTARSDAARADAFAADQHGRREEQHWQWLREQRELHAASTALRIWWRRLHQHAQPVPVGASARASTHTG